MPWFPEQDNRGQNFGRSCRLRVRSKVIRSTVLSKSRELWCWNGSEINSELGGSRNRLGMAAPSRLTSLKIDQFPLRHSKIFGQCGMTILTAPYRDGTGEQR